MLKQRNALLRGGVRDEDARTTLDVFDDQLVARGRRARPRAAAAGRPARAGDRRPPTPCSRGRHPAGDRACTRRSGAMHRSRATTPTDLEDQLRRRARTRGAGPRLERGSRSSGPHRDELRFEIGGLDARTQASQGEQRTLALALRLAGHHVVTRRSPGAAPVLLLDDVFSELDGAPRRRARPQPARRADAADDRRRAAARHRSPTTRCASRPGRITEDDT